MNIFIHSVQHFSLGLYDVPQDVDIILMKSLGIGIETRFY